MFSWDSRTASSWVQIPSPRLKNLDEKKMDIFYIFFDKNAAGSAVRFKILVYNYIVSSGEISRVQFKIVKSGYIHLWWLQEKF